MNIHSTISALYAIMCEARVMCESPDRDKGILKSLLASVSDADVNLAVSDVEDLLGELAKIKDRLASMYILSFMTGTDEERKKILLLTEIVYGQQVLNFTTAFDEKAAQSLIEGMSMQLALVRAGDRLSEAGNA